MRRPPPAVIVVLASVAMVAGLAVALGSGRVPLGVPGEWEWLRVRHGPGLLGLLPALAALGVYGAVVRAGGAALGRDGGRFRTGVWLAALVVSAVIVQAGLQQGAPEGYGLEKWILALENPGSSGYFTVARDQMDDPARFLSDYPGWIARQDAFHIGTHPPGLFVVARVVLGSMRETPTGTRWVLDHAPPSTAAMLRATRDTSRLTPADAATLVTLGTLTLLACSLTVVPTYALSRGVGLSARSAWASAAFWPVVPGAILFQPTADTAFPLLSASALALAAWSWRDRPGASPVPGLLLSATAGAILGVGMLFTLAFLPVGVVVGLGAILTPGVHPSRRVGWFLATGAGFLLVTFAWWAATSANPWLIWWCNQRNHGRFYVENPRTYLAWVMVNPVETAVSLGIPATVWTVVGLGAIRARSGLRVAWLTGLILVFLTLGGRSLSEVGRLWIPFFPPLLVLAGAGWDRLGGGPRTLAASVVLAGLQVLVLEAFIQVVYPV